MIKHSDPNDRRMLKFPAVRPCESVSPHTLLSSLLNLTHTICSKFQSKPFSSHRRNARELVRQVTILHVFFEELLDYQSSLTKPRSKSVLVSLSELHVVLQKIQFLLEDCTHEGAKIWILIKSKFVANQFHELSCEIATALDAMPLRRLFDISSEIKELVRLLSSQARRVRLDVDPRDQCAMEQVIYVINQFENGFDSERSLLKGVLDYLEIKAWSDCDKEVRFLEEELDLNYHSTNNKEGDDNQIVLQSEEFQLLSSLMALMCYCRGVFFEDQPDDNQLTMDHQPNCNAITTASASASSTSCSREALNCLNPEDFRCPITLELMKDPVAVSTGQTYDRASIHKWLKSGNSICPKTGKNLTTNELVPNTALKRLIQQFCSENGASLSKSRSPTPSRDISRTTFPGSSAAEGTIRFLAEFLAGRLTYGTDEQKKKAAYEIGLLTKSNIFNRSILIEVGAVPQLLNLLTSTDAAIQENGISALFKLSKHKNGQKVIMLSCGLTLIIQVLGHGLKAESRYIAAALIYYLASIEKYRKVIGSTPESIPALTELVKDGSVFGKRNAIAAIYNLLLCHRNRERALTAGIVPLLVNLIENTERTELIAESLAVLGALAESIDGSIAVLQSSGLESAIGILESPAHGLAVKEHCVSILLGLCMNLGAEIVSILAKDHSVMPQLYGLITNGNSQTSKKARKMINMLLRFHESGSSSSAARLETASMDKEIMNGRYRPEAA